MQPQSLHSLYNPVAGTSKTRMMNTSPLSSVALDPTASTLAAAPDCRQQRRPQLLPARARQCGQAAEPGAGGPRGVPLESRRHKVLRVGAREREGEGRGVW